MRKEDIVELLEDTKESIYSIEKNYIEAINDESVKSTLKVRVKNCLENLRSCLDYISCDVYEKHYKKKAKNIYFPYGKSKQDFESNLNKKFKDLKDKSKDIYDIIESIQPYKCGDSWLVNLCLFTNKNKHDNLSKQKREDFSTLYVNNIKLAKVGKGSSISFSGCTFGNIHQGGDIKIQDRELILEGKINCDINKIDWVNFKFENTDIDILELLKVSYREINILKDKIYNILIK